MSQTQEQRRFTISEVAADWHELMILRINPFTADPVKALRFAILV